MNCESYVELMSAALDGQCTPEERRELDSHLAVCPECARLFRILSANTNAARELDCEVPADLKSRIMSNLPAQEQPAKQGKVIHWKRWVPVAAAACMVLVISLFPAGLGGIAMDNAAPEAAPAASSMIDTADAPRDGGVYGMQTSGEAPQFIDDCSNGSSGEPESAGAAQIALSNPRVISVHYGATPKRGAMIIGCVDTLEKYLSGFGSLVWDGVGNNIPISELEALREVYTEDFFKRQQLLCVLVESGSGSNRYEIVALNGDTVTVLEDIPEVGTCDMAAWLLVAEIDTAFDDGSTPDVEFVR